LPALGRRLVAEARLADDAISATKAAGAAPSDYHAHRVRLGVPEGGKDFAFGDTFPHEALLDQLNGVSFTKGCFVGQEVVSRMEHRATTRKRIVSVIGDDKLPHPGTEIRAGQVAIGTLGSTAGRQGLALLRLDRAAEALEKGLHLAAGPVPVTIELPDFATFSLPAATDSAP
jgi:folate-binding protein YgfZ